jgi:CRP/FNR family transcriptional regulator
MIRINKLSLHRLHEIAARKGYPEPENRMYQSGEMIFAEDTPARDLFYIERGTILLRTAKQNGTEVALHVIGSNNFIGFLPLIQKKKYNSTALVLQDNCRLQLISKELFQDALTDVQFLTGCMKILCDMILSYEKQTLLLKTKNANEKLATILISLNDTFRKSGKIPFPMITIKKKDLAGLVGVAPETLSRNLAALEQKGLIELHLKGIKIKQMEQLSRIGDGIG